MTTLYLSGLQAELQMCLLRVPETLLTQLYSPEAVEQYHGVSHLLSLEPRGNTLLHQLQVH